MLRVCIPRRRDTEAVMYERRIHKNGIGAKRGLHNRPAGSARGAAFDGQRE
jgi:hypothetical protein